MMPYDEARNYIQGRADVPVGVEIPCFAEKVECWLAGYRAALDAATQGIEVLMVLAEHRDTT